MPRITFDALSAFAVFADHLHMTRAATALHITQPALHTKLKALARQLDCTLWEHQGHRLVLTPEGEQLARFARDQQERLTAFLDELHEVPASRPVVLAAGHAAYLHILGDAVRSTLTARPGSLRLLHTHRHDMLDAVRAGRAHLGVSALDVLPADLTVAKIASYPQVLLTPADHHLATRRSITLADLDGADLVVPPPTRPHRANLERALRGADVHWNVAVETEGWPLMIHFASLGVGLAIVTGCVTAPHGLSAIRIRDLPPITYYAVHRDGALRDSRTQELLRTIRTTVAAKRT
ncbi:LysR family transcriptional regulator [Symbioplanes lichenis]|uniref:LysR family transcriptional regulator n=1 Tax=Symbioplanes lichenis TaxID=1629072 RepID=UPI002738A3AE|nr:LysR family transcriptional regulator [Actinoplanes lichenis]